MVLFIFISLSFILAISLRALSNSPCIDTVVDLDTFETVSEALPFYAFFFFSPPLIATSL